MRRENINAENLHGILVNGGFVFSAPDIELGRLVVVPCADDSDGLEVLKPGQEFMVRKRNS